MSSINLIPIKCRLRFERFDLVHVIYEELKRNRVALLDEDILVVSSKFASVSEGRFVNLAKVVPSKDAKEIAKTYRLNAAIAQLIIEESVSILGGVNGFVLATAGDVLAPNAGIDRSNAPKGWAVLYPKSPAATVRRLRRDILSLTNSNKPKGERIVNLGVVLSDSRVTPTRLGTVGVAVATVGIRNTVDMRGKKDLFKNDMKVTVRAIADQVATAAQICMGEAAEAIPVVVIRGVRSAFTPSPSKFERRLTIAPDKCLIISGLRNGFRRDEEEGK